DDARADRSWSGAHPAVSLLSSERAQLRLQQLVRSQPTSDRGRSADGGLRSHAPLGVGGSCRLQGGQAARGSRISSRDVRGIVRQGRRWHRAKHLSSDPAVTDAVISVRDLSKRFKLYRDPWDRVLEWLTFGRVVRHESFWALQGINLEVKKGECVGVIGVNGAGKTTLLKILSRAL